MAVALKGYAFTDSGAAVAATVTATGRNDSNVYATTANGTTGAWSLNCTVDDIYDVTVAYGGKVTKFMGDVKIQLDSFISASGSTPIADDSISTGKLQAGAVTAEKIGAGAVVAAGIGTGAVTEAKIGSGAVTADKIGAGAITTTKLGANSVGTSHIQDGAITAAKLADGVGTGGGGTVADGSITTAKLANLAVTTGKIAAAAVGSSQIATGAVTNTRLGTSAVSDDKIQSSAVTAAKIASGAVTTTKIDDGAVTAAKLASSVLGAYAPFQDIAAASSGAPSLSSGQLKFQAGSVNASYGGSNHAIPLDGTITGYVTVIVQDGSYSSHTDVPLVFHLQSNSTGSSPALGVKVLRADTGAAWTSTVRINYIVVHW